MARQRKELEGKVTPIQRDLESARRDTHEAADKLAQWRTGWTAAVAGLGLEGDARPAEANAVLTKLDELLKKLDEADELAKRIEGIDRDARVFEEDVKDLVARIAPDLLDLPAEQAAAQLNARLNKAQADAARKDELNRQSQEKEAVLQGAQFTIKLMREQLDAMCRQAGCSLPEELPALETHSAQAQELHKDIEELEQRLLEQSGGATLNQLIQEAEAIDADAIPAQLDETDRQ
ncbi:MAG: hypothetical protein HYZ81_01310, partial [Nitrospinae bacterium]|nr:hypothetical protein [Nitrospinota bacterium]